MSRISKLFRPTTTRPTARKARLGIQALEGREVPSATLSNEVLTVTGTNGNDTIEILSPQPGQTIVRVNGAEQFSGSDTITKITIDGRLGGDQVFIRGIQSGVTDGAFVKNAEFVTVGDKDPVSGAFSTDKVRSELTVTDALQLILANNANTAGQHLGFVANGVTGLAPAKIFYSFQPGSSLIVRTGSGADTFEVNGTPNATVTLRGGDGADTFTLNQTGGSTFVIGEGGADVINVAPKTHSLASIGGRVTITDGSFQDKVTITDQNRAATADSLDLYTAVLSADRLSVAEVERNSLGAVQIPSSDSDLVIFKQVASVDFAAAARPSALSEVVVRSSAAQTATHIDVGGAARVQVGSGGGKLDGIAGPVSFAGGSANTTMTLLDGGQTVGQQYNLGTNVVTRGGMGAINIADYLGPIVVQAGSGNDVFTRSGDRADGRNYGVDGGAGTDRLATLSDGNLWDVQSQNQGSLNGRVAFTRVESLTGHSGDDTFRFANGVGVSGRIDGGGGFDTLDYSSFLSPVVVNLGAGTATRTGGISRILNVFGGKAGDNLTGNAKNNVLLGNGGADQLNGGSGGRDLLVGGAAGDTLTTAGTGDTIYVGGDLAAADQNKVASVKAIMTEWTGSHDYATRVANLASKLSAAVLAGDGSTDAYTPKAGQDVFFVDAADTFSAGNLPAGNEQVISVD